ncbi:MAG: glycerate kinase [Clostridia bacterium]|nr:glycerate kinase [Clostridia bacterium]
MNKILLMPDSFKGTVTSLEACGIMEKCIKAHFPQCNVISIPIADGGEGTAESFVCAMGGRIEHVSCKGPLFEDITACYAMLQDSTAVIELAAAAGITLAKELDPRRTTTYGVGQLVRAALDIGAKKIILAIGGSATNDFGCGIAAALGVRFYDRGGKEFIPTGGTLAEVDRIDATHADPRLKNAELVCMCDVTNPPYGPMGAAHVFAPQKGADAECVELLDAGVKHLCHKVNAELGTDVSDLRGGGAAGACGAGMHAFFGFRLQAGIDVLLDTVNFEKLAADADMIFTGEGRLDSQTLGGKVVSGIGNRAKALGVPVVAVVGGAKEGCEAIYEHGVTAVFTTNRLAEPFDPNPEKCKQNLAFAFDNIIRILNWRKQLWE